MRIATMSLLVLSALALSACDVEKQMDTMVDNPTFAEPLFVKFMARSEYQMKAMDTILADAAMRQMLFEKVVANADYARAVAEQLLANEAARQMVSQMMTNQPTGTTGEAGGS